MKTLRFAPAAYADIDKIWDYTAEVWSLDQADRYTDDLQVACESIALGMNIGKGSVKPGVLKSRCGSHVIYYRMTTDDVEIIRVLHGKQDVERHL